MTVTILDTVQYTGTDRQGTYQLMTVQLTNLQATQTLDLAAVYAGNPIAVNVVSYNGTLNAVTSFVCRLGSLPLLSYKFKNPYEALFDYSRDVDFGKIMVKTANSKVITFDITSNDSDDSVILVLAIQEG